MFLTPVIRHSTERQQQWRFQRCLYGFPVFKMSLRVTIYAAPVGERLVAEGCKRPISFSINNLRCRAIGQGLLLPPCWLLGLKIFLTISTREGTLWWWVSLLLALLKTWCSSPASSVLQMFLTSYRTVQFWSWLLWFKKRLRRTCRLEGWDWMHKLRDRIDEFV